jgi:hypothetical protein
MNHPLQCRCGTLKGYVSDPDRANHCMCYCRSCKAFAHFLGRADDILDAQGGSEIIQTIPAHVTFTQGLEVIACMRLTEKGLMRWYTTCCNTPIGNTHANFRLSFVGLVHNVLEGSGSLDEAFGPIRMWANTKGAKGQVPAKSFAGMMHIMGMLARARLDGSYKHTAFFSADTGIPIVTPKVLGSAEYQALMSAVER